MEANSSKEKLQLVRELHRPARKNFPRRHVIVKGLDDLYQADLCDMKAYAKENKQYKYILTVLNVLSKYGFAKALRTKSAKEVTKAFEEVLKEEGGLIPRNLHTDEGKEFFNSEFQGLMKRYKINHYATYSVLKAPNIERWNRTLKEAMWRQFSLQGNYKWLKMLPELVKRYNDTVHRTIKMRPSEVTKRKARELLKTVYSNVKIIGPSKFKVGQSVRVSKYKQLFEKGYTRNYSTEVFTVHKIRHTNPVTYILKDFNGEIILGGFYEPELTSVAHPDVYLVEKVLKRRGDRVYVKWLGLSNESNSWIHKDNAL